MGLILHALLFAQAASGSAFVESMEADRRWRECVFEAARPLARRPEAISDLVSAAFGECTAIRAHRDDATLASMNERFGSDALTRARDLNREVDDRLRDAVAAQILRWRQQ